MAVLLLLLASLALLQQNQAQADPCNSYTLVSDEFKRSSGYSLADDDIALCDTALTPGWYRFRGDAGEDLVNSTECRLNYCGTLYPVCLKDAPIPTEAQGEVTATACVMDNDGVCGTDQWQIRIKGCNGYRVYYLTPPPSCPSAYCVGGEVHCESDECSETGFTPCSADCPKDVTVSPTVTVDSETALDNKGRIIFRCTFTPPAARPDLLYNVYWYVNDERVATFLALTSDRVGVDGRLQEDAWSRIGLNMVVKCALRARFSENLPPAGYFYSQPFFAGLEVNETEIAVEEGHSTYIQVRSTVPVPYLQNGNTRRGTLRVNAYTPANQSSPDAILQNVVFSKENCAVDLPLANWNSWTNLEVTAAVDSRYDNSRIMLVRLGVEKDRSDVNDVWTNISLPDVKVTIVDKDVPLSGRSCSSMNDPHMMPFIGGSYENQNGGEYILYEHALYPFSVHTKYQRCYTGIQATCNCGVAIRAYDSLLVVDRCNGQAATYGTTHVNHISYTGCNDRHLLIRQTGNTYTVRLPTGTQVRFTLYDGTISSVDVTPSPADIGQTRGLCGPLQPNVPRQRLFYHANVNFGIDFPLRDGGVTTSSTALIDSWRVQNNVDSLFVNNPTFVKEVPVLPYCFCDHNIDQGTQPLSSVNCTIPYPVPPEQQIYTDNLKAFLHTCGDRVKKDLRTSDYVSLGPSGWTDVETHIRRRRSADLDWRDGWTEERARNHCREAFQRSPGVALMEEATAFSDLKQTMLDSCVLDIKYTASTYYTQSTVEVFKRICKTEVEKNVTLLETEVGRTLVAEIANASCPMDCSGHGTCNQGECQCDQGYKGVDCSVDTSLPPGTPYIPQGGLCNTRVRACESTPVLAGNLPETGAVFCGFRPFQIRVDGVHYGSQRSVTVAEPWTQGQVQCPFPRHVVRRQTQSDVMAEGYMVSLSNNNVTYSPEVAVVIYDADCMTCSADNLTCIATGQCTVTTEPPVMTTATTAPSPTTTQLSGNSTAATSGPCSSYHLVQDEYQRSVAYDTPSGQALLCDRELTSGWFRFQSGAGGDLQPLSTCSMGSCGTTYPVCVKEGEIPTVTEGEVNRTVCLLDDGLCALEWPIRIQNCGGYRVYYLTPTPSCPSAYCVGTEVPCPPGLCSSNGFTPGCKECPTTTTTPGTTQPAHPDRTTDPDESNTRNSEDRDPPGETGISQVAVIALAVSFSVLGVGAVAGVAVYLKFHNAPKRSVTPTLEKPQDPFPESSRPVTAKSIFLSDNPAPAT